MEIYYLKEDEKMNDYAMNGMEPATAPDKIRTLNDNHRAIFESVENAASLYRLYNVHGHKIPKSSVRRILYILRNKLLIEKLESGKWRQIRYAST